MDGPLDIASLLHTPHWRLGTTVRRKSAALPSGNLEEAFEDYTGDATFVRFPNGSPHPRRHRRSGSADMAIGSAAPMAPSWSPTQMGAADETFVSDTPRLRVFEPISSPQPSTSKTVTRSFPKYRPSGVHKENSAPRGHFAVPRSSTKSNPRPMGSRMRKSLSTSSLPRPMSAVTPTSRTAFLLSNRGQQQSVTRYRQPQSRPNQ